MDENQETKETGATALIGYRALLGEAEALEDKTEVMFQAEVLLLRKVASASSDIVKARHWPEFREAAGMENLEKAHETAVMAWEQWVTDGDDSA
jgi:hypothetical protein